MSRLYHGEDNVRQQYDLLSTVTGRVVVTEWLHGLLLQPQELPSQGSLFDQAYTHTK